MALLSKDHGPNRSTVKVKHHFLQVPVLCSCAHKFTSPGRLMNNTKNVTLSNLDISLHPFPFSYSSVTFSHRYFTILFAHDSEIRKVSAALDEKCAGLSEVRNSLTLNTHIFRSHSTRLCRCVCASTFAKGYSGIFF